MAHLLDVLVKSEGREEIRVLLDVGAQVSTESTEQRYDCCLWGRSPGEESNFFTDAIKENWASELQSLGPNITKDKLAQGTLIFSLQVHSDYSHYNY